ncbi:DNA cytosine methyltransferase [uncultured Flavobacterium sp.]|uniref:DNA cytosine methyltransferase n=1 Tax=uncultured Flavobacterium sp. TaxID=165435 RepID=UPI00292F91C7|nr:DNA cytosine methyltransferase [uncultured Flavobacterium sp.]
MKLNVIDLFSGCGGLTDGFLQTGKYKTLAAVDWEFPTVLTLQERLKTKWKYDLLKNNVLHFDIQRTDELLNGYMDPKFGISEGLIKIVGDQKVNVIIGGPPCQAYSIAGRVRDDKGMQDDYRNYLFESYVKIVDQFKPNVFVFENVEGILSAKPGGISIIERIRKSFNDIGYEITENLRENALFDTSFYSVPQKRKRVIIFGVKKNDDSKRLISEFYNSMKNKKQGNPSNAEEALKNLPKIFPFDQDNKTSHKLKLNGVALPPNHEPRFHSKRDIEIFKILTSDIEMGLNKYTNTKALIELYKEKTGKESKFHKYNVIRSDKPSNTIPAHLYKDGLRHIHPDSKQARSITVREAGRIQTFDDDFEFFGSKGDQYKMIGNAVPPNFAKIIASVVYDLLT